MIKKIHAKIALTAIVTPQKKSEIAKIDKKLEPIIGSPNDKIFEEEEVFRTECDRLNRKYPEVVKALDTALQKTLEVKK